MKRPLWTALALLTLTYASFTHATDTNALNNAAEFDAAVADEGRLIAMLKASGKIPAGASLNDAETAVRQYLKERSQMAAKSRKPGELYSQELKTLKQTQLRMNGHALTRGNGNKLGANKQAPVAPLQAEGWNGSLQDDPVLVLLIEFPDYPHNSIQPGETAMYYPNYTPAHYADLLFSGSGYAGPQGQNLVSMRQHYQQDSGGSYSVHGTVAGWYMAPRPAAYYGNNVNGNARSLVRSALLAAAADPSITLSNFDQTDRYDLDGDGNLNEPDGLIDHLMIFHSAIGEEAGGGALGEDAVWSHRWNLGGVFTLPGSSSGLPYWGGRYAAYDYTIQPIDAAAGVATHEFGHDLGLPDEYDTAYSGAGEPVSFWSIMSSGSWAGRIPGTEPTGFSAWAKQFLQGSLGGNWWQAASVNLSDLNNGAVSALLDASARKGSNLDAIRVNLPDQRITVLTPVSGRYVYHGGKGDNLYNRMSAAIDLTGASAPINLNLQTWYQIETDWDYAYVRVFADGVMHTLANSLTTNSNPNGSNEGNGITGSSNGWLATSFDLSAFAGKNIVLIFDYVSDAAVQEPGFYLDDIQVQASGNTLFSDDVEGVPQFGLNGFSVNEGYFNTAHHYLLEWRDHSGVDQGLAHIPRGEGYLVFNPGLLMWYVDDSFSENWVGVHPGQGFLGVVDADQKVNLWSDDRVASTPYQIHDAAFSLRKQDKLLIEYPQFDLFLQDNFTQRQSLFDDAQSYWNAMSPSSGRLVPMLGLKVRVTGESGDRSVGRILLYKE